MFIQLRPEQPLQAFTGVGPGVMAGGA